MPLPPVYSTLFGSSYESASGTYAVGTVPAGYIWVVRCISVFTQSDDLAYTEWFVKRVSDNSRIGGNDYPPGGSDNFETVLTQEVVNTDDGLEFYSSVGPCSYSVSGYLLTVA